MNVSMRTLAQAGVDCSAAGESWCGAGQGGWGGLVVDNDI